VRPCQRELHGVLIVSGKCLVCEGSDVWRLRIHTMSHHHTYYVTSSYILCHIIIHSDVWRLRIAWGWNQGGGLVQPRYWQCTTGWEEFSTRGTLTCVVWCSWPSKSSFLPPPLRLTPCGPRAAGLWVKTPESQSCGD